MRTMLLALFLAAAATNAAAQAIEGTIALSKSVAARVKPGGTVYVYVRPVGQESGPPVAVLAIANPSYPLQFALRPEDQMVPGAAPKPLAGPFKLYARHSPDSMPMKNTGFVGTTLGREGRGVAAGSSVRVLIDRKLP